MSNKCAECGVPKILSKTHTWRDGCVVDSASGAANLCMYEVSFHNAFVDKVSEVIGIPLDRIIYDAGRHASERVIRDMFSAHPLLAKLAFSAPLYRLSQRILVNLGKAIGVGNVEILEHSRGKSGKMRLCEPYHMAHCLAIIAGALQVIYGFPVSYTISEDDGCFLVELSPGQDETTEEESFLRLTTEDLTPVKHGERLELPVCRKCGVPRQVGTLYDFDTQRGVITEKNGGERVIFIGLYSLNAIIREFEKELGYDINDLFINVEKENFLKKLAGPLEDEELWDEPALREYLALRGLGMLSEMKETGEKASITVDNAFIAPMVAGRILALWENRYGKEGSYSFHVKDNALQLVINE